MNPLKNNPKVLFIDHDDTVVNSQATIHYPAFVQAIEIMRPNQTILDFQQYIKLTATIGFERILAEIYHFTPQEIKTEYELWQQINRSIIPPAFANVGQILQRFIANGNYLVVYSANTKANISRDYDHHFKFQPHTIIAHAHDSPYQKPARTPLLLWMHQHQITPLNAIILDDSPMMIETARRCNCTFLAANWSPAAKPLWINRWFDGHLLDEVEQLDKIINQ